MSMNEDIARIYNTNGINETSDENLSKEASLELFAKVASKHGVDLASMDNDEIGALYEQVMGEKLAQDESEEEEKSEEKMPPKKKAAEEEEEEKEAAANYFFEKKAQQEKLAEADMMGRVMAHAFWQEKEEIEKQATTMPTSLARVAKRALKGGETGAHSRRLLASVAKKRGAEAAKKGVKGAKEVGKKYGPMAAAAGGGGAAGASLAGKKKESAAERFEELSAMHAVKIAEAAGYDVDQAHERVEALWKLGIEESEKIAHVDTVDDAIHVRGLEYLEAAGVPVDWEEVFAAE